MKRFHVHVAVDDLDANVRFYSKMFGTPPTVLKLDYAKWMLEDPRVNFAISKRGVKPGVDHLGVQVESDAKLHRLREQVAAAEIAALDQSNAECCYARSDKYWITDPQGISVGDFPHARLYSCLWRDATGRINQPVAAPRQPARVESAKSKRLLRVRRIAMDKGAVQRSVPMHRQFGPQHHGGSDPKYDR